MPELQSNRHPAQEIDGSNATGYYGGVKANEYHELSQQQKPAEVAGTEARQEMGHDEVKGTGGRPFEMEAREARR